MCEPTFELVEFGLIEVALLTARKRITCVQSLASRKGPSVFAMFYPNADSLLALTLSRAAQDGFES